MRREDKGKKDKLYGWGLFTWFLGMAGIAEHITSGRGSFMVCAVLFSVGLGMILWSYT